MDRYRSLLTGLVLLFLFFTVLKNFDWQSSQGKEIYFSDFLTAVTRDEVMEVNIRGNEISGKLVTGNNFQTQAPFDPTLVDKLQEKNILIKVEEADNNPWYFSLLLQWGPLLLLIGVWIFFMRKMPGGAGKIFNVGKSKARKYEDSTDRVTFSGVAGVQEAKDDLQEVVDFLRAPERFSKLGGKIPKGVLMVGSPGTGKTLLAKAVAGEAEVPFFSISGSDFVEMFVGVGASRVRDLFEEGRKSAPCIIFIDEIDAVGRHRGAGLGSGHDEREQTLNQLLVEMDGFDTSDGVIIIAATNRMDILDPALLRPGRFDRQVHVPLPDIDGRHEILKVHVKKIELKPDTDLRVIARGTPGFSGAELANLVNEAALWAARQNKKQAELSDLEWARDKIMMGAERRSMIMNEEEKKNTAYHEAGHALVAAYLDRSDPVHKVTIIPRGRALGLTSFLPETDRLSMDKESLKQKIMVAMGGRAAEELIFNERSTGAEGDIKSATDMAHNMITKWGMSERLGALTIQAADSGNFLAMDYNQSDGVSDDMLKEVDQEISELLNNGYKAALEILKEHKSELEQLAEMLLEKETVNADEFLALIGRAPVEEVPEEPPVLN